MPIEQEKRDAVSLLVRSGYNHLRYIKPAAERQSPTLYAGKVESTVITLLLDQFRVTPADIREKSAIFRACSAFNLQWRAYDEVVDEARNTIDPITEDELDHTPVYHKYAGRGVTGQEGLTITLESMYQAISGKDAESRRKRDKIEGLLVTYRQRVAETANNPKYQSGDVLPYQLALGTKNDVTGLLGEVGAGMFSVFLDINDADGVEMFRQASVAMQFGDDYLDWRKDWKDHSEKKRQSAKPVRPNENLLAATLEENQLEKALCETCLTDTTRSSALWVKELAPNTLDLFKHRFQTELDRFPPHPYRDTLKGIISLTFYQLLPKAPESGWFFRWAKY
ncbi:hypothetical protein HY045_02335 [Candidatus Woesebacteria bacterium]|nr:hypothetical protein [Candidatus Woesebacteria bacterium]